MTPVIPKTESRFYNILIRGSKGSKDTSMKTTTESDGESVGQTNFTNCVPTNLVQDSHKVICASRVTLDGNV